MSTKTTPSKLKKNTWLPVVAAIIRRENKVLLGQRPDSGTLAGLWEFPGGKIEMGEAPDRALARELKEELGIDADIGPIQIATTYNYSEVGILLLFYVVNSWRGQPEASHHNAIKWVDAEELKQISLPDANRNVLDKIIHILK